MSFSTKLSVSVLALAVGQLTAISPAFAQPAPTAPPTNETPAPNVPVDSSATAQNAAPDAADQGLGAIIVTATKRETNLQQTPIAISVVDPQLVKNEHIQNLNDLANGTIPTLRVATFEARKSALTVGIRGMVPFDQNQTARDNPVGVYIDGIYLGRAQGLNAALFDIERIEVLRGPQGTLFGRNTEGGALSIVTAGPTGEFEGRLTAGIGNYGSHTGEFHVNLPEVANIAFKFDGMYEHQGPTVKNPLSGQVGWNYQNDVGGRVSARWRPFDGFSATVSYDQAKDENTPNFSQLINYNPQNRVVGTYIVNPALVNPNLTSAGSYILVAPGSTTRCTTCIAPLSPLVRPTGDNRLKVAPIGVPQQPSVDLTHGLSLHLQYDLAPHLQFRSITGWRGVDTAQWDNSGGAARTTFAPYAAFSRYSLSYLRQRQFSQEFQLVGSLPTLDYVLGLYYFNEHVREAAATPTSNTWNLNGTGYTINSEIVPGPITSANQGWDYPNSWFVQRNSHAKAQSYAAFGQVTWSPLEQIHITAGGRWTKDKRNGALTTVSGVATPWTFTYDNSRFDPLAIVSWTPTRSIDLYAKYSTGYRAGGANDRSATFLAFGPEAVKAYEAGAKMDFLDHRMRLNVAGFIMNRTGTQTDFDNVDTNVFLPGTSIPNPTFNLHTENTANAPGTSKIKGVEADLTIKPVDNLTMGVSYAYTDVKIPATPNPNLAGNPLYQVFVVYTPKNAASGFITYDLPVGGEGMHLQAHLDAAYSDPVYSFQNEPVKTDKSFVVNGRLALADIPLGGERQSLTVAAWARNLFDTTYIYRRSGANDAVLGDYGNFNPPRTFGVEATVNFGGARPLPPVPVYAPPAPPPPPPPAPTTRTCADGSVVGVDQACPVPPPPAVPRSGERG